MHAWATVSKDELKARFTVTWRDQGVSRGVRDGTYICRLVATRRQVAWDQQGVHSLVEGNKCTAPLLWVQRYVICWLL